MTLNNSVKILVIGGGLAGLTMVSALNRLKTKKNLDITLIEPSDWHHNQTEWFKYCNGYTQKYSPTHLGNLVNSETTNWVDEPLGDLLPEKSYVLTASGKRLDYDYLIIACGLSAKWDSIKGLYGKLGRDGIASVFSYENLPWSRSLLSENIAKRTIFAHPENNKHFITTSLETAFLYAHRKQQAHNQDDYEIKFNVGSSDLFFNSYHSEVLEKHLAQRRIRISYGNSLIEVRPKTKEAVFYNCNNNSETVIPFDLLHVAPSMIPPVAIKQSTLSDIDGLVDVNNSTLQTKKWHNIFALGDISNATEIKNISSVMEQTPVVFSNLTALMDGRCASAKYTGLNHCFLTLEPAKSINLKTLFSKEKKSYFFTLMIKKEEPSHFLYFYRLLLEKLRFFNLVFNGRLIYPFR